MTVKRILVFFKKFFLLPLHNWMLNLLCVFVCLVTQSCPTLWVPARLLCTWGFSRQEYWSGLPCLPPGDLPNPGMKPRSPTLQADSSPTEPVGKPKNTGVRSLSLLQGIFLPQESLPAELPGKPQSSLSAAAAAKSLR